MRVFLDRRAYASIIYFFQFISLGQKSIDNFAEKNKDQTSQSSGFVFSRFLKRFYENLRNEIEKNK